MTDHWWKNAIIYGIDVERFCDSDGDGIGDFAGLASKLPYLAELGVTCVWLLPFFPSTNRDNGYDIADYYRVDSRFGLFDDFLAFVRASGEHGIRIIIDLVAHHTSIEHPWFQSARHDPTSPFRDYYVWSDHPPPVPEGRGTMFPGQEHSVWTFDELARSYYYHRFYKFQPGLNHHSPRVRGELERIMDFWLSFGISGFRVDAASHMVEQPLDPEGGIDTSHAVLRHIYSHVTSRKPDALLLGEVDEDEHRLKQFFDGEQLNMLFNFFLDNYLLLALARQQADPIRQALSRLPPAPANGQWANFLRNLDEADLERLDEDEMAATLEAFAPSQDMRIFGRGIRRRLAPMLGGNLRRLKLAYSLLFSLPGAPVICYGDEIGMGEDLSRKGRNAVRAPMQWSAKRNGGFSQASKRTLVQPLVDDPRFGYRRVNVAAQLDDETSLLGFIGKLARLRRNYRAIGEQDCRLIPVSDARILAHSYHAADCELMMLHNLCDRPVDLSLQREAAMSGDATDLLAETVHSDGEGTLSVELEPYGLRWLSWPR